jgi:cytochrome c
MSVKILGLVLILAVTAACGRGDGESQDAPVLTAAMLGEQTVLSAAEYLAQVPYAAADRQNGERLVSLCRACHSLAKGGAHMIGPNLYGFFGSDVGSRAGFDYSAALLEADFVWTPAALDAWLTEPALFLPGNRMAIAGMRDKQDRIDLIAYLLQTTSEMREKE